jgi:hypothetical protein
MKMKKFCAGLFGTLLLAAIVIGCSPVGGTIGDAENFDGSSTSPASVNLGTAGNFVILAKTGISTTGTTAITGNLGLSPSAATFITGFALIGDGSSGYTTSALVTGNVYASDYTSPTPSNLTTAVSDMETAYTDAAGRAADVTEYAAGNISGRTLYRGVYKWGTGVLINSDITISGDSTDVWIFQIAQDLTIANGVNITLSGGALAQNIVWQVAGQVAIGTTASVKGVILSQTQIALNTGAVLNGRALAQSAVTLDANTVTQP